MGKLTIIGNDKPVIGKQEMYSVAAINGWLNPLQPIKNPLQAPKAHWEVMVQTKTGWRKGGSDKEGQTVPFTFGQKSLFHKGIKIIARQGEDYGELIVHPQRAKESKITRVELLDANYKPIPKGKKLSYKDTIIARAYCVEMFEMNIAFTLWEDDAQGEGHNPTVNALNKINPVPVLSRVNEKGMAEAVFRLPFYTMAVMIANARTASGDKSEGATHEYYVTADVVSKHIQKASPNVNVVNPTHNPEPPRKREVPKGHTPTPPKPKTTPAPEKPKPKPDSPKFPVTTGGKKSDDPQGKILSAEFVDGNGNKLHSSKVGTTVKIKITAKEMKGKKVKVKIWEEDNFTWSNDLIYEKDWVLAGDTSFIGVQLTKQMFDKAKEFGTDSSRQDYFIEVIHNDTSVKSAVMPVSADAEPTKVESGNSATMVKEPKLESKNCGGKYCIDKNSAPSELIREINIRLAGFGGNVPTDKFTDRTERMIKQFQRDYMKVPETGKVCGNVLKAIDDFCNKWAEKIINYKCLCHASDSKVKQVDRCPGYGKGLKNEHPGIHRTLLWGVSSLKFYLSLQNSFKYRRTSAGYRCVAHNKSIPRSSTNHMGKAVDIQFNEGSYEISGKVERNLKPLKGIRDKFYIKYLKAEEGWSIPSKKNNYRLEPIGTGKDESYSWIHMDVSLFETDYLKNSYFAKEQNSVIGKSIVTMAEELGYKNLCNCMGGGLPSPQKETKKEEKKGKWSHTEFANLIAQEESNDNYNICNQTKGGLKIIYNVKITELTIKEIQKKQKDRDIFAVGRYQMVPDTINGAVTNLGLDVNEKLDKEMQDKIFDEYLIKVKRPKVIAYLEGNGSVEAAIYTLAQEWASIGVEKGKPISDKVVKKKGKVISRTKRFAKGGESYYADDGLNKSHIAPEQIKTAIINSKNANK